MIFIKVLLLAGRFLAGGAHYNVYLPHGAKMKTSIKRFIWLLLAVGMALFLAGNFIIFFGFR